MTEFVRNLKSRCDEIKKELARKEVLQRELDMLEQLLELHTGKPAESKQRHFAKLEQAAVAESGEPVVRKRRKRRRARAGQIQAWFLRMVGENGMPWKEILAKYKEEYPKRHPSILYMYLHRIANRNADGTVTLNRAGLAALAKLNK